MVAGMGRGQTGTDRAIACQDADIVSQVGIMAGAKPENEMFQAGAADLVAKGGGYYQQKNPAPSFFTKVHGNKDEEKEVKGNPEFRLAQERKDKVGNRVCPVLVDLIEQPMISLQ
jgi:hypothetical protein